MKKTKLKLVKTTLSQEDAEKLQLIIEAGLYKSKSEFLHEAVREKLEKIEKSK